MRPVAIGPSDAAAFIAAALISAVLLLLLQPLLRRYALARPNARSSHEQPTPQGGGLAVTAATVVVILGAAVGAPGLLDRSLWLALVAFVFIALVGLLDDARPIPVLPRLVLQALAVILLLAALPDELRFLAIMPWWIERALLFIGILWFVNLTNFMDGIDWMTVAETVPLTVGLAFFGWLGALPPAPTLVACALCGAVAGFAPFNRPVARLFLGDVGSLPIGLLLAWLLVQLAGSGHFSAALLLPLYYLADATTTLLRRLAAGKSVLQPHRDHFYQHAFDAGFGAYRIVGSVFLLNVALVGLAAVTLLVRWPLVHAVALAAGFVLVGLLLLRFGRTNQ